MKKDSLNDILPYFSPVEWVSPAINPMGLSENFGGKVAVHKETSTINLDKAKVVLIGSPNSKSADAIRSHLYQLSCFEGQENIADLGNFRNGKSTSDTAKGWEEVLFELGKKQKVILILGDNCDAIGQTFNGVSRLEHPINLTVVSPDLHLIDDPDDPSASYINRILLDPDSQLFDYSHIGYQSYLTNPGSIELLNKMFFNHIRLGELRTDIREVEPYFRDSDILAFSMASVRYSDAPDTRLTSPNGLYAEEACQLARFAGLSDKLSIFQIFDLYQDEIPHSVTANLAAQIVWHFLQGVMHRKKDYPFTPISSYSKYIVNVPKAEHEISFYKSQGTERWWLEVPYPGNVYERSIYVACTGRDYQLACNGEIPDRWLKNYQRIC